MKADGIEITLITFIGLHEKANPSPFRASDRPLEKEVGEFLVQPSLSTRIEVRAIRDIVVRDQGPVRHVLVAGISIWTRRIENHELGVVWSRIARGAKRNTVLVAHEKVEHSPR